MQPAGLIRKAEIRDSFTNLGTELRNVDPGRYRLTRLRQRLDEQTSGRDDRQRMQHLHHVRSLTPVLKPPAQR